MTPLGAWKAMTAMNIRLRALVVLSFLGAVLYASPSFAAPTATASHPPPVTTTEDWMILFAGMARAHGVAVSDAELRGAVADRSSAAFQTLTTKIKAPPFSPPGRLDFADVDNDGANEYVLSYVNPVGMHQAIIVGVFRPEPDGTVADIPLPAIGPAQAITFFEGVSLDREGVTLRFEEDDGHYRLPEDTRMARYLWKGGSVRLLDRLPVAPPPPASRDHLPPPLRCTVQTPSGTIVAAFDYGSMTGTLTVDGDLGVRRFNVRAAPYNGTYNLVFRSYGTDDKKPPSESLTAMTSLVARLVSYGQVQRLYFDGHYRPGLQTPTDGFVCK
jgi:hypothetical protein